MADLSKTVELVFKSVDDTRAGIESVINRTRGLQQGLSGFAAPLADVTNALVKFEAGVIASGAALVAYAVNIAGQFDDSFKQIATLTEQPASALGEFRQQIIDYGKDSTQSFDEITQALQEAIGTGIDYKDSLDFLRSAEELAVATRGDMSDVTGLLATTLNAYGKDVSEVTDVSDIFNKTILDGKINIADLAQSFGQVAPIAAQAGVGLSDLGAAIAVLTAAGLQPASAIEGLRSALANVIKPSQEAQKLSESLGLSFNVQALQAKGLSGFLQDVADKTGGSADKMAILFGDVTGLNVALALTKENGRLFNAELAEMAERSGSTARSYAQMADSFENGNQRILNNLKALAIEFGTVFLDETTGIQGSIVKIIQSINQSFTQGNFKQITDALEGIFKDIDRTFAAIAKNLPEALATADLSDFLQAIQNIRDTFSELFGGIDLTTVEGLRSAIELTGTAFFQITNYVKGAAEVIGPLVQKLFDLGRSLLDLNPNTITIMGNLGGIASAFQMIAPAVDTALLAMIAFAGKGGVVATALDGIKSAATGVAAVLAGGAGLATGFAAVGVALAASEAYIITHVDKDKALRDALLSLGDAAGTAYDDLSKIPPDRTPDPWLKTEEGVQAFNDALKQVIANNRNYNADDFPAPKPESWEASAEAQSQFRKSTDEMRDSWAAMGTAVETGQAGTARYIMTVENGVTVFTQVARTTDQATTSSQAFGTALRDSVSRSLEEVSSKSLSANEQIAKLQVELEKIASNERLKTIELGVKLKTEQIQADRDMFVRTFDSIDNSIKSTQDALGDLWGTLGKTKSEFDKLEVRDAIDKEQKRRDQAFELQKKLTEAEIDKIRAQTEQLQSGEAMLKIEAEGLEPALEMIFWEVIKKVRIKASAEMQEFLLGIS